MLTSADQLLAHAIGDYVLQSDWQANEKTKRNFAAMCHALSYGLPFLYFRPSVAAMTVIVLSHFAIDRWRLARYVVWVKNFLAPRSTIELGPAPNTPEASSPGGYVHQYMGKRWHHPWSECAATGYHRNRPAWMAVWLLIIVDNVMHVIINALALKYL